MPKIKGKPKKLQGYNTVKYSVKEREMRCLVSLAIDKMEREACRERREIFLAEKAKTDAAEEKRRLSEDISRKYKLRYRNRKMNAAEFKKEFRLLDSELKLLIEDGLPFKESENGDFVFDETECREWFLHGWFDSQSPDKQKKKMYAFGGMFPDK